MADETLFNNSAIIPKEEKKDPWEGLTEDEQFDALNEGIIAMQIIEWFEKRHPEPQIPESAVKGKSISWDMWEQWQRELVLYADGWKDALKALQERAILEKCLEEEPKWFTFFEFIWGKPEDYLSRLDWMTDGEERRYQWIIDLMLFEVDEEELEDDLPDNE